MKTTHKQNTMTALEFIKEFENTQKIMESIADKTVKEEKTLLESQSSIGNVDESGKIKLESILDVEVGDSPDNQPSLYSAPVEELTNADKALIINEFTKKLEAMKADDQVIDFSSIGPIATVIQDQLGYKVNIENFLQDTIQKATKWKEEQNNTQETPNGVAGNNDGGPSDITPEKVEPGTEQPNADANMVAPALAEVPPVSTTETGDINAPAPTDGVEPPAGTEPSTDGVEPPAGTEAPTDGVEPPAGTEAPTDGVEPPAETEPSTDDGVEPPAGTEPSTDDGVEPPAGTEPSTDGVEPPAGTEPSTDKNPAIKDTTDKDDDDDKILESIKNDYLKAVTEAKTADQTAPAVTEAKTADQTAPAVTEAKTADHAAPAVTEAKTADQTATDAKQKAVIEAIINSDIQSKLESIANNFHKSEDAKLEAIEKEKKVSQELQALAESIKHEQDVDKKLKSIVESVQALNESAVDEKLNAIAESAKSTEAKNNLNARMEAREKIENGKK